MSLHRVLTECEPRGDLGVAQTVSNQTQHLDLSRRQHSDGLGASL